MNGCKVLALAMASGLNCAMRSEGGTSQALKLMDAGAMVPS
jgi:membrane protease subunit (stomatin/prohibitin family)